MSNQPRLWPGQMWHLNDAHHGNVLAIVQGEMAQGEWSLLTFSRLDGAWVRGYRDVVIDEAEMSRATYLGELPTFQVLER